jgi:hypothetical protein
VTDSDLLPAAVAELYSCDPADFVERRGVLAARARAAGDAPAAKRIAALRKPTRSAWVVNRLVRSDPGVTPQLIRLGDQLRAAQGSLDGASIRELSTRRRQLIAELSRQAFTASGLASPSPALRDEVTATLAAALVDQQVAGQLAAGALERPARAEGFGGAGPPVLTLMPGGRRTEAAPPPATPAARAGRPVRLATAKPAAEAGRARQGLRASREQTENGAQPRAGAAAREGSDRQRADRESRRRAALAEAEQTVAQADAAAATATRSEQDLESTVQRLEEELADARQGLATARVAARRARNRLRQAGQALGRLRAAAVDAPHPRT